MKCTSCGSENVVFMKFNGKWQCTDCGAAFGSKSRELSKAEIDEAYYKVIELTLEISNLNPESDFNKVVSKCRESISICIMALESKPDDCSFLYNMSEAEWYLGRCLNINKKLEEARAAFVRSFDAGLKGASLSEDSFFGCVLWSLYALLSLVKIAARMNDYRAEKNRAVKICERLEGYFKDHPDENRSKVFFYDALCLLGQIEYGLGNDAAGKEAFEKSIAVCNEAIEADRKSIADRKKKIGIYRILAGILRTRGDVKGAMDALVNCIEVCAEIKEYALDDEDKYKPYLAQTLYELGSIFKSQEAYDLAEKYFNDALPILEENMQKHPENVTPKQFRCYLLCELGELLRDTGRTVQAEECFERFLEYIKEFAAPKYASRKLLESAVAGFNALFEFINARHDRAAAKKYYEYGKELRDNLVNPYKEETELLEQYDTLLEKLKSVAESPAQPSTFSSDPCGENEILSAEELVQRINELMRRAQEEGMDVSGAEKMCRQAAELAGKLAAGSPSVAEYQLLHCTCLCNVGGIATANEDYGEASAVFERCFNIYSELSPEQKESANAKGCLLSLFTMYAGFLNAVGDSDSAEEFLAEAAVLAEELGLIQST